MEVRLTTADLERPIRFFPDGFCLNAGEVGWWTIKVVEEEGETNYELEYYGLEQFGEHVRNPTVMHWSSHTEGLVSD